MRDLQFLVRTRIPFVKLRAMLSFLAQNQGQMISLSDLGRRVQLSAPTAIQLIQAFEDLFVIRRHGKGWFMTDSGVSHFLGADKSEDRLFAMQRFVYQELYAQLNYLHKARFDFDAYQTRGGANIPFVVTLKDAPTVAIVVDASDGGSEKSLKSLTWFMKKRRGKVVPLVLHRGQRAYVASNGALCLPYYWIA